MKNCNLIKIIKKKTIFTSKSLSQSLNGARKLNVAHSLSYNGNVWLYYFTNYEVRTVT